MLLCRGLGQVACSLSWRGVRAVARRWRFGIRRRRWWWICELEETTAGILQAFWCIEIWNVNTHYFRLKNKDIQLKLLQATKLVLKTVQIHTHAERLLVVHIDLLVFLCHGLQKPTVHACPTFRITPLRSILRPLSLGLLGEVADMRAK